MTENKISLVYNYGFKWNSRSKLHVKGYIFYKEELLRIDELDDLLKEISSLQEFGTLLNSFQGLFSIILERDNIVFASVDPTRTFPLFYKVIDGKIKLTDNSYGLLDKNSISNEESKLQLMGMRYVLREHTTINDIKQIRAGECLSFTNRIEKVEYHSFSVLPSEIFKPKEKLSKKLDIALSNAVKRLIQSVNGRTLIVPLSGGYDSRLIISLLHEENYKDVICFTYGNENDEEVQISKKVAEKLGYKWFLFDSNKEYVSNDYLNSTEFQNFVKFSYSHTSLIHLQDYFFIKEMRDEKMIPDDAIFLPGHTGDVIAGNHLYKIDNSLSSAKRLTEQLVKRHFILKKYETNATIKSQINKFYNPNKAPHSLVDNFNLKERQAKFIVNSVRNYEFFGYEHRLILWDQEFSDFFKRVSFDQKLNCKFYKDYIFTNYFEKLGVDFIPQNKKDKKGNLKKMIKPYIPQNILNKFRKKQTTSKDKFGNLPYKNILLVMNEELGVEYSNSSELTAEWLVKKC